jgi:hypothetical protein
MSKRSKSVVLAVVGTLLIAATAVATHPRPRGASPLHVSLVPAFKPCTGTGNSRHGSPLAFPSCKPPVQESNFLTVGTPDANGAAPNSVGSIHIKVTAPSFENEVQLTGSVSDVRCLPGVDPSVCNSPNTADGPDYSGSLDIRGTMRVTDHYNGSNLDEAATVQDIPFVGLLHCVNTADTSIGGLCTVPPAATCPPNCSISGRRTVIELSQIAVVDGGPDGNALTNDNTLFLRQGVFIP